MPFLQLENPADWLRAYCTYDPAIGVFRRNKTVRRFKAGEVMVGTTSHGYVRIWIDGKQHAAHRLAWLWMTGHWPAADVDHIDGNRANNAWVNLRQVDRSTNLENIHGAKSHNRSTGLLGAYRSSSPGRFVSRIQVRGKDKHLGSFGSALEAHAAYMTAKRELHSGNTL